MKLLNLSNEYGHTRYGLFGNKWFMPMFDSLSNFDGAAVCPLTRSCSDVQTWFYE
jgi:hypothetical protein